MQVKGIQVVAAKLNALARKVKEEGKVSVVVGFTQRYAIYVHENLQAHHPVGQAKFLEAPVRSLGNELAATIETVYVQTGSMRDALLTAGLRLQREAQLLTPVDTSALRASAFTAFEEEAGMVASESFSRSEALRQSVMKSREKKKSK